MRSIIMPDIISYRIAMNPQTATWNWEHRFSMEKGSLEEFMELNNP